MIKIAAAKGVKQFGFDDTGIDCQSTMNEWCLIENKEGELEVAHMETGGILCGGTSQECADHIEKIWARGNEAINTLRVDLADKYGKEVADELVPDAKGGVQLLKLKSAMHDTCNTANAVVTKLAEKKEASSKAFYGNDAWASMTVAEKSMTDWRCGNHTRGLSVDAYNRRFENFLHEKLGAEFQDAAAASCGRARLEKEWSCPSPEHV